MSKRGHIVWEFNRKTVEQKYKDEGKNMINKAKEVQVKLMKGLLDLIVLQFLSTKPMHGYQIITRIRKNFGVYFGPSTIYPLLNTLEKRGYVKSEWDMHNERPRKVYRLTTEGKGLLNFTEDSLNYICRKIGTTGIPREPLIDEEISRPTLHPFLKKIEKAKPKI
ncbi:PadR family transcriptional regulator [Candidatus Bathyarchaeota archaeon]|nr:PadR family transcriptional regulator [Candidatus Bathyarchaeota archaeon]